MRKRLGLVIIGINSIIFSLVITSIIFCQTTDHPSEDRPTFRVPEIVTPIRIDGKLNESAWNKAVVVELTYEIDPGENTPARIRTECLLISDKDNLYIGFRAYDPEPSAIRAHYMDRDTAFDDDWVFITLDPFMDERRGFQFLANPLGVQMDTLLNEVGSGAAVVDETWDAIWNSAGHITADGYEVEMAIPYTSLRFPKSAGEQKWGFQAMRHYPRKFAYFFRATPWNRNRDCMLCENAIIIGFSGATPGRNIEINPTITSRRSDMRHSFPEGDMQSGKAKIDSGISTRWGVTPNVQFNATLNPDFSQVEADVAQLDINTRFALFYPEKRSFFLEGADLFGTPFNTVYTRTLADPSWGLKLTGKESGNAFGVLVARDELTNLLIPANQTSQLDSLNQDALSTVLRYRRDLGKQSTLGVLMTDRRGNNYYNSVFGFDGNIQLTPADSIGFQLLRSQTSYPETVSEAKKQPKDSFASLAINLSYRHESRNWNWWATYDNLGRDFRADVGFIPRVDTRTTTLGLRRILWGKADSWYRKLLFTIEGYHTDDHAGKLTDRSLAVRGEINGPLQSILQLGFVGSKEFYNGVSYDQEFIEFDSSFRPTGSLALLCAGKFGDAIDYTGSRQADIISISPGIAYFFGQHLQFQLDHSLERLDIDCGHLYSANLTQVKLVYQFNVRTFTRAIFQYLDLDRNLQYYPFSPDPIDRKFFTQLLFSYKLNPQTLLFLGYSDNRFGWSGIDLTQNDRTFFIKLSYAWLL
jgi:hypothetical protein